MFWTNLTARSGKLCTSHAGHNQFSIYATIIILLYYYLSLGYTILVQIDHNRSQNQKHEHNIIFIILLYLYKSTWLYTKYLCTKGSLFQQQISLPFQFLDVQNHKAYRCCLSRINQAERWRPESVKGTDLLTDIQSKNSQIPFRDTFFWVALLSKIMPNDHVSNTSEK